jgi:hypothetical protein
MIHAYFIGGPADLQKHALPRPLVDYRIPRFVPLAHTAPNESDITPKYALYRLVYRTQHGAHIYEYQPEE